MLSAAGLLSNCGVWVWYSAAAVEEKVDVTQMFGLNRESPDGGVRCWCSPGVATDELEIVAESQTVSAGDGSSDCWMRY